MCMGKGGYLSQGNSTETEYIMSEEYQQTSPTSIYTMSEKSIVRLHNHHWTEKSEVSLRNLSH